MGKHSRSEASAYGPIEDKYDRSLSRLSSLAFVDTAFLIISCVAFVVFVTQSPMNPRLLWMIATVAHVICVPIMFATVKRPQPNSFQFAIITVFAVGGLDLMVLIVRFFSFGTCSACLDAEHLFSTIFMFILILGYIGLDIAIFFTVREVSRLREIWEASKSLLNEHIHSNSSAIGLGENPISPNETGLMGSHYSPLSPPQFQHHPSQSVPRHQSAYQESQNQGNHGGHHHQVNQQQQQYDPSTHSDIYAFQTQPGPVASISGYVYPNQYDHNHFNPHQKQIPFNVLSRKT